MARKSRLHWPVTALPFAVLAVAAPVVAGEAPFADDQPLAAAALLSDMVASVDIDADGDLDLVGHGDEHLRWVERGASGDWTARSIYQYPAGTIVYDAAAGDLDGDGDLDVVAWRENDEEDIYLDWLENDGTPADGPWTKRNAWWSDAGLGTEHMPLSLAIGDVDGDGDLDLVAGWWEELFSDPGGNGRINWWENDGGDVPTWNDHTIQDWWGRRWPRALAMGDLDRDGDLDLAGAMAYDGPEVGTLYWWSNDGTPANGAWARTALDSVSGPDPNSVGLGDFDRDGDLDVVAKDYIGMLELYENRIGDGGGWALELWWSIDGSDVRFTDLDGDGWLDLLLTLPNTWIENRAGSYSLGAIHDLSGSASGSAVAGDLDGDGDADVAFAWGTVYWLENRTIHRSATIRDERVANGLIDGAFDVTAGDVDGDGDLDLVSAAEANDHVYLHRNSGTPGDDSLWSLTTLTSAVNAPRAVALGDLDGDADLDVAVASYNDDSVSWLENDGTLANWTKRVISAGAGGANDVALGDFDRDGDLDIACAQYLDDEFSWYRNDGASPPGFAALFVDPLPFVGPRALAAGDLDGDGDLDLATASEDADALFWYENDGAPGDADWSRHRVDGGESDAPKDVALADLDADGDLDLLVAAYVGDVALWYENDGSPSGWTARTITTCNGARSVAAGDFDRDGDDDVLVACYDEDRVMLQASNGGSPPDLGSTVSSWLGANGARTALAADLDRDNNLDGVVAQGGDDQIAWYDNGGGQFRVYGTSIVDDPLRPDTVAGLFRAEVAHRGRAGDGSIELASVAVRLEEAAGDPLSSVQAIDLIDDVLVHGDDGDGIFEVLVDPLLAAASAAGIDGDGVVRVALADLLPGAEIPAASQRTFFVALDLTNPFGASAPATLRATLLTDGDSMCEADDREHQIPLDLQWRANVSTATVPVLDGMFSDGFESGDTSEWSSVFP